MKTPFYAPCLLLISLLISSIPSLLQAKETILTDITFGPHNPQKSTVFLHLNQAVKPKIFTLNGQSSPRVIVDLPGIKATKQLKSTYIVKGALLKSVRTGIHTGAQSKVRVVFDLKSTEKLQHQLNYDAKEGRLSVTFQPEKTTTSPPSVPIAPVLATTTTTPSTPPDADAVTTSQAETTAKQATLLSIKFDRSSNRGEMILFELSHFSPPEIFGIEEGSPRVVCDFLNTTKASSVMGFEAAGEFVQKIRVGAHTEPKTKVRVVMDLTPNYNYDLQQVFFKDENLFVIIINTTDQETNDTATNTPVP